MGSGRVESSIFAIFVVFIMIALIRATRRCQRSTVGRPHHAIRKRGGRDRQLDRFDRQAQLLRVRNRSFTSTGGVGYLHCEVCSSAAVGVPEMVPELLNESPTGKEDPVANAHVSAPTPPLACKLAVYAVPTVPPASEVVLMFVASATQTFFRQRHWSTNYTFAS